MTGRIVKLLLGLVVGAACLWLAFRGVASADHENGVSWAEIGAHLRGTAWWGYAGVVALFLAQVAVRVERWRVQVRGLTGAAPPWRDSLAINAAAFAAVFLLPFRLGELVRPNLAAQRGILPAAQGFAASALERVVDGMVTMGFFGVVLLAPRAEPLPAYVTAGGWTALVVFGGAAVVFALAFRLRAFSERVTMRVVSLVHGRLAERVAAMLRAFLDGFACFRRPVDLVAYLGHTVAYWTLNAVSMWVLLRSMGIDQGLMAAAFCLCFVIIGVMIPAPPGNVGNFHAFARLALRISGVALAPAVAYAIMLHALSVACVVGLVLVFLLSGDLSLSRMRQAAASQPPTATPATPS
ncbi:MAG: flippase-like domain-containing protein [Deltaproteobacteria bacterium]|nr:flippase-like domain-containing protein [Deltaproteobacteria bacterium]